MDNEVQLPLSLSMRMNDNESLTTLRAWAQRSDEGTLGGALRVHAPYDKQRAKFVKKLETEELQRVVDEFKTQNSVDTNRDDSVSHACSWQTVDDILVQVESEYNHVNSARRALRGGVPANLASLVEAIPDDDGLGILKAGILILLAAMKRRSQACKIIIDCFRNIPDLINRVEETLGRFARDEDSELYGYATSLYSAIVDCLPSLINHLLRHSDQSKIKQYGIMAKSVVVDEVVVVEKILQPLTKARNALEKRASRLTEKRFDKMASQVAGISSEINVARRNQHQKHYETTTALSTLDYNTGRILQEGRRVGTKVDAIEDAVTDFVSTQYAQTIRLHEENAALREKLARLEILNSFHMITEEKQRNQIYYTESTARIGSTTISGLSSGQIPNTVHTLDQLLQVICDDRESTDHVTELYSIMQQYEEFSEKSLSQAAYLSEKDGFRRWLLGTGSANLLVDGHCSERMSLRSSPLSVFCATLIQSLLDLSSTSQDMVLHFFCGQHLHHNEPLCGPQGLIRSLTVQVIFELWKRQLRPNLHFLTGLPYYDGQTYPQDIDLQIVCRVFINLVSQLPRGTTVHCVVDGISQYETTLENWSQDLMVVVDCLLWCGSNLEAISGVSIKCLFASADSSSVICERVPPEDQVDLSSGDYYGSVAAPEIMRMDLSARTFF